MYVSIHRSIHRSYYLPIFLVVLHRFGISPAKVWVKHRFEPTRYPRVGRLPLGIVGYMLLYMGIEGWVNTYTSTWFTSMSICDCVCGSKTWVRYWYPKQEGKPPLILLHVDPFSGVWEA